MAITSYKDSEAEMIFGGNRSRRLPPAIQQRAREGLKQLDAAVQLNDLRIPPSNRLEALKGKRDGQHSIRINEQYRICFRWEAGNAADVEIVDYH
jgi:proteic killer suppression protein